MKNLSFAPFNNPFQSAQKNGPLRGHLRVGDRVQDAALVFTVLVVRRVFNDLLAFVGGIVPSVTVLLRMLRDMRLGLRRLNSLWR
jgi:hypothetical protein